MLAAGYSPVYPAHVPLAECRQRCVGTGPFKLKEYSRGEYVALERNPDYFIRDDQDDGGDREAAASTCAVP